MSTPSTIAHVVLTMNIGGLERLILDLTERSIDAGDRVLIVCLDETGLLAAEAEQLGAQVRLVPRRRGPDPGLALRLASLFRREGVTAVHTHSLDPMLYAAWAGRLARVPVRVHTQHLNIAQAPFTAQDRRKFRLAARACTSVVSITAEMDAGVKACGIGAAKRRIIFNGIDQTRFTPRLSARASGPVVIGTTARLSAQKALDRLLRAFALVHAAEPGTRLRVVGDGPLRHDLEALARTLHIDGAVEFAGYRTDTAAQFRTFDIFALSSLFEGLPLALLEAMASGLPAVASAVNGVPEVIVDGESGLLVPPDDVEALSTGLLALVRNQERREEMGRRAVARVAARFSLDAMAASYNIVYRDHSPSTAWKAAARRAAVRLMPRRCLFWSGSVRHGQVALTFDDGPDPIYTPQVLEILRRYDARATFFVVGGRASAHPEIIRAIVEDGHEVANHSYTHAHFRELSWRQVWCEIQRTEAALIAVNGSRTKLFRPPRGTLRPAVLMLAWMARLTVVMWNVDLKDYAAQRAEQITGRLSEQRIGAGDIVLYHGQNDAAVEALPRLIESMLREGLRLVPVSRLGTV